MLVSRLLFAAERQTGRLARGCVSIPRGSGSPLGRSRMACGYPTLLVHFGLVRFFAAIPTRDDRSRLYEKERRVGWAFLLIWFADSIGYRGENAGAEMWKPHCGRPRLRQRAIGSLDSLHLIRKKYLLPKRGNNRYLRTAASTPRNTRVHGKTRPALIYGRTGRAVYRCYLHAPTSRLEAPPSAEESGCVREAVCVQAQPALPM